MTITASSLSGLAGIRHAFFTRAGGVSSGIYATLNAGIASKDDAAHVDFEALGMAAESMGAAQHGPIEQSDLLLRLGIEARANALKAAAFPEKKAEIDAAFARLIEGGRTGMGRLFKAMALADPKLGPLPAFDAE